MEDNSAAPAKCELLARLQNANDHKFGDELHGVKPYQLPPNEFRAYIEAEIASARCGPAPVCLESGDDDELVDTPAPAAPRRQRKRSLAKVCEAARKAGADRVIVDGVVIAFSLSAAVPKSDVNEWDTVLPEVDHGPH